MFKNITVIQFQILRNVLVIKSLFLLYRAMKERILARFWKIKNDQRPTI